MRVRKFTKEHLIRDYLRLKKKLGRQPTCAEFERRHHSITLLCSVFGRPGWRKLLKTAGDKPLPRTKFTRKRVVRDYLDLKKELGRAPTSEEYAKRHCSISTLHTIFRKDGWHSLLKAAGEKSRRALFVTRAALVQEYHALKTKLGRRPRIEEYEKACYGMFIIIRKFGRPGWRRLLKAAGDEPLVAFNLPAKHLIADFLALQEKLGRRPKAIEYTYQCHTPKVLDRVFGKPGWRRLLEAMGEKAMPNDFLTAEHLIQDYVETCKALGREPSRYKFQQRHRHTTKVFDRVFGKQGWRNLQKAASKARRAGLVAIDAPLSREGVRACNTKETRTVRTKDELMDEIRETYRALSPENLTGGGKVPPKQVRKKAWKLRNRLNELFREAGQAFTVEEIFRNQI